MTDKQKTRVIEAVKKQSGEVTITQISEYLISAGVESCTLFNTLNELIRTNKMIIDNQGLLCWTYNPALTAHYRAHPELRVR